jgi:hypothetical protein
MPWYFSSNFQQKGHEKPTTRAHYGITNEKHRLTTKLQLSNQRMCKSNEACTCVVSLLQVHHTVFHAVSVSKINNRAKRVSMRQRRNAYFLSNAINFFVYEPSHNCAELAFGGVFPFFLKTI